MFDWKSTLAGFAAGSILIGAYWSTTQGDRASEAPVIAARSDGACELALERSVDALSDEIRLLRANPSGASPSGVDWPELRQWIADAIATAVDQAAMTVASKAESSAPVVPSALRDEARRDATRLVDDAIARGRWDLDDEIEIRGLLDSLEGGDQDALLQQLTVAINEGEIEVEAPGSDSTLDR